MNKPESHDAHAANWERPANASFTQWMESRVARYEERRYDWDAIAAETLALYRWVLGQGERPGCVRTD